MGVIAWIVLGIIAGAIAEHLISGRESHGLIVTCLIGVARGTARRLDRHPALPHPQPPGLLQPLHLDHRAGRGSSPTRHGSPGRRPPPVATATFAGDPGPRAEGHQRPFHAAAERPPAPGRPHRIRPAPGSLPVHPAQPALLHPGRLRRAADPADSEPPVRHGPDRSRHDYRVNQLALGYLVAWHHDRRGNDCGCVQEALDGEAQINLRPGAPSDRRPRPPEITAVRVFPAIL